MTIIEKLDMNVKQANSDFTAIKNKIIEKGVEVAEGTRTADYAEKVDEVYETGRKAEYDAFWDNFQKNGYRISYRYSFYGNYWTDALYNPKYPIVCEGQASAQDLFHTSKITDTKVDVYFGEGNTNSRAFGADALVTIRGLHISENIAFLNTFQNALSLENLTIIGVIGQNGFDVKDCKKLSKASIESIMAALSTATNSLTVTLSKTAVNNAFTDEEWTALVSQHNNWTISLI